MVWRWGGIPIVTMLSHHTRIPAAFIRKTRKEYGTCNYVEGTDLAGKRIVLVEDVVSSGGAILDAVGMLRSDGIAVDTAICVLDRQTGGACELMGSRDQTDQPFAGTRNRGSIEKPISRGKRTNFDQRLISLRRNFRNDLEIQEGCGR